MRRFFIAAFFGAGLFLTLAGCAQDFDEEFEDTEQELKAEAEKMDRELKAQLESELGEKEASKKKK